MAKGGSKYKWLFLLVKATFVCLFTGGFIYQTLQFLFLYWTYPTVVDIQQSSPSFVEIPSFTFCNRLGYRFLELCDMEDGACPSQMLFGKISEELICPNFPIACINNGTKLPPGFQVIYYSKFMQSYSIKTTDFPRLAVPLEEYLECSIEFAGKLQPCNMENVLGSFYSTDDLPQFCYTIYSKWGNPDREIEKIPKGGTMKFRLFLNATLRSPNHADAKLYDGGAPGPLYNIPTDAAVQIAVHSPYFLPSPFFDGTSFLGGRAYELRIKLSESHLLPLPYQTNCTDYMTTWRERGGKGPINQLNVIQECRINKTFEELGCIPMDLDYPHNYNICKGCSIHIEKVSGKSCKFKEPPNDCPSLAENYNQPCDSMTYSVDKENKMITIIKRPNSPFLSEDDGLRLNLPEHDCEGQKTWRTECGTIDIDVPFDRFEITNITYNPKFESLELFSVIGGYMGMWLGISLLTVFDLFVDFISMVKAFMAKKKRKRSRVSKSKQAFNENFANGRNHPVRTTMYNAW